MGRNRLIVAIEMCLGLLAITIPGCALATMSLVDEGIVSIEILPSEKAHIVWADVYTDGADSVVYGVIDRHRMSSQIKAHVDITILSPDGAVQEETRTLDVYIPRRCTIKGSSSKRFGLRFPDIPEGSAVVLAVHDGPHEAAP